jgi:hypothetical protein
MSMIHQWLHIRVVIPTFTIPATNDPQLNAPISFGTEMNLSEQGKKESYFELVGKKHYSLHKRSSNRLTRSSFSLIMYSSSCSVPFSSESATWEHRKSTTGMKRQTCEHSSLIREISQVSGHHL